MCILVPPTALKPLLAVFLWCCTSHHYGPPSFSAHFYICAVFSRTQPQFLPSPLTASSYFKYKQQFIFPGKSSPTSYLTGGRLHLLALDRFEASWLLQLVLSGLPNGSSADRLAAHTQHWPIFHNRVRAKKKTASALESVQGRPSRV